MSPRTNARHPSAPSQKPTPTPPTAPHNPRAPFANLRRAHPGDVCQTDSMTDAVDPIVPSKRGWPAPIPSNPTTPPLWLSPQPMPTVDPPCAWFHCKHADDRGFVFYTHNTSPKGQDLTANPRAASLFSLGQTRAPGAHRRNRRGRLCRRSRRVFRDPPPPQPDRRLGLPPIPTHVRPLRTGAGRRGRDLSLRR